MMPAPRPRALALAAALAAVMLAAPAPAAAQRGPGGLASAERAPQRQPTPDARPPAARAPADLAQAIVARLQAADRNGDGVVDWSEVAAVEEARFRALDATGDGVVSFFEFAAQVPQGMTQAGVDAWRASRRAQFDALDADRDGRLTRAELTAAVRQSFAQIDGDRDGKLSAAELEAFLAGFAERIAAMEAGSRIRAVDGNHDGKVSRAEFDASRREAFAALDRDKDGVLARAELVPQAPPAKEALAEPPAGRQRRATASQEFQRLDANADGRVTIAEFMADGDRLFRALDRDGDGMLSADAVKAGLGTIAGAAGLR